MKVTITHLERNTVDDVVTSIHWSAKSTDGKYSAIIYGELQFDTQFSSPADSPTFIPFTDLTEEDVIGWLNLPATTESTLLARIQEQKLPKSVSGIPWLENA